jgi:DNA uptake protein and related DNA-binding proteins
MQRKRRLFKSSYFNTYSKSAKLYSAIIFLYCLIFAAACRENSVKPPAVFENSAQTAENAVDLNTATAEELEKLPTIGAEFAKRIIEHRERFGKFRRPEHLMLVRGISDKKFRKIRNLVTVR